MDIKKALFLAQKLLNSLDNPPLEAEILLETALKKPREFILSHPEKKLDLFVLLRYCQKVLLRKINFPYAYLAGEKEFYGYNFQINRHCLIPRPETELMVNEALPYLKKSRPDKGTAVIDVGTGSGCVLISLLNEARRSGRESGKVFKAIALDISGRALRTAEKNAAGHDQKKIIFIKSSLLTSLLKQPSYLRGCRQLIITANLPYLTPQQYKKSSSIKKEPRLALIGGHDGLKHIQALLFQIKKLREQKKFRLILFLEIDPGQKDRILALAGHYFPSFFTDIKKDLRGLDRLFILKNTA